MRYESNADLRSRNFWYSTKLAEQRKEYETALAIVVELLAALIRLDRNGYQARLIAKVISTLPVTREDVDAFNVARAERIAQRKAEA